MKPYSPQEAANAKKDLIPEVIEIVNNLLAKRINGNSVINITQEEVVDRLKDMGFTKENIFEKNLLDFEESYRQVGWRVTFDKPGYNESYGAFWQFKKK